MHVFLHSERYAQDPNKNKRAICLHGITLRWSEKAKKTGVSPRWSERARNVYRLFGHKTFSNLLFYSIPLLYSILAILE